MQRHARHVKGSNVIDLVKFVKVLERQRAAPGLSHEARTLMQERLLPSAWYSLDPFVELLNAVDELLLHGDEARALQVGEQGGLAALQGPAKLYLKPNDPLGSVLAMRHGWRARHDFGDMVAEVQGARAVRFTLHHYEDIAMVHALTTAGWGTAAARAAGATEASVEIEERPWRGGSSFRYRIMF